MKNVSRNRFLLCFRPIEEVDVELESDNKLDCSSDQVFTYIAVAKNNEYSKLSNESSIDDRHHKTSSRRSFSRTLKAVLFESSLTKRVRYKDSFGSAKGDDTSSSNLKPREIDTQEIKISSLLTCSSPSRVVLSESKKTRKAVTGCSSFNYVPYLILVTLSVTIFYGRLCGILFTLIWLYCFIPRRCIGDYQRPQTLIESPEMMESFRDYKKRVIMEGLLERNNHRGH